MKGSVHILGFLCVMLLIGCGSSETNQAAASRESVMRQNPPEQPASAKSSPLQSSDSKAIVDFNELTWEWNRAVAPLVRDYLDPNVPGTAWVKNAGPQVSSLRGIHMRMATGVLAMQTPRIRTTFQAMSDNYRLKLDALTVLLNAVAAGDVEGEQRAKAALQAATTAGTALGTAWLDEVRPYVNSDELAAELKRRGKEMSDLMGR